MAGEEAHFIVIDSGHGFFDAGKIGVSGALEKDINLAIALKLKADLESQGFHVRMTREHDVQLYDGMRPSDKKEDMQKRVSLMTDENCILAVSIHQNSFTEEKYRGAQVFYYGPSERSSGLATSIMCNAAEEALLKSEMYQEKTAWAISVGIVRYLNGSTEKGDIEHDR